MATGKICLWKAGPVLFRHGKMVTKCQKIVFTHIRHTSKIVHLLCIYDAYAIFVWVCQEMWGMSKNAVPTSWETLFSDTSMWVQVRWVRCEQHLSNLKLTSDIGWKTSIWMILKLVCKSKYMKYSTNLKVQIVQIQKNRMARNGPHWTHVGTCWPLGWADSTAFDCWVSDQTHFFLLARMLMTNKK